MGNDNSQIAWAFQITEMKYNSILNYVKYIIPFNTYITSFNNLKDILDIENIRNSIINNNNSLEIKFFNNINHIIYSEVFTFNEILIKDIKCIQDLLSIKIQRINIFDKYNQVLKIHRVIDGKPGNIANLSNYDYLLYCDQYNYDNINDLTKFIENEYHNQIYLNKISKKLININDKLFTLNFNILNSKDFSLRKIEININYQKQCKQLLGLEFSTGIIEINTKKEIFKDILKIKFCKKIFNNFYKPNNLNNNNNNNIDTIQTENNLKLNLKSQNSLNINKNIKSSKNITTDISSSIDNDSINFYSQSSKNIDIDNYKLQLFNNNLWFNEEYKEIEEENKNSLILKKYYFKNLDYNYLIKKEDLIQIDRDYLA